MEGGKRRERKEGQRDRYVRGMTVVINLIINFALTLPQSASQILSSA